MSILGMLSVFGLSVFFYLPAYADISSYNPSPEIIITVYFEKDGKPYDKPVDFAINCYAYEALYLSAESLVQGERSVGPKYEGLTYVEDGLIKVFLLSDTCPHYGCEIVNPFPYVPSDLGIDYCECEGETEGESFVSEVDSPWSDPLCQGYNPVLCELRFDIPTSLGSTDSDTDGGNNGGCFISTLQ